MYGQNIYFCSIKVSLKNYTGRLAASNLNARFGGVNVLG